MKKCYTYIVRRNLSILLILLVGMACSKEIPIPAPPAPKFSLGNLGDVVSEENFPTEEDRQNLSNIHELDKRYKFDCIKEEWFYCPPLNAVWQFKIVTDI